MTDTEKLNEVKEMAIECMNTVFIYRNKGYRMSDKWKFSFNNLDFANGQCAYNLGFFTHVRNIFLSQWVIVRAEYSLEFWKGVMLHEIAHAIDVEIRGTSNHDEEWLAISKTIGGDTNKVNPVKWILPMTKDKYMRTCPTCGVSAPLSSTKDTPDASCGACHPNGFSYDHMLKIELNPDYIPN
jgi:predicted SprT family Zn-dependent metalloprotease